MIFSKLKLNVVSDTEVELLRDFKASQERLFDCWTKPELLKKWMTGPEESGWSMPVCEVELKVGGKYRYVWKDPDENEMGMTGSFKEIDEPSKLVSTEIFDEDWTGGETENTITFEQNNEITRVRLRILFQSKEGRDIALSTPMESGMEESYQRLELIL